MTVEYCLFIRVVSLYPSLPAQLVGRTKYQKYPKVKIYRRSRTGKRTEIPVLVICQVSTEMRDNPLAPRTGAHRSQNVEEIWHGLEFHMPPGLWRFTPPLTAPPPLPCPLFASLLPYWIREDEERRLLLRYPTLQANIIRWLVACPSDM